ncbi:MAG: high frequency lysogenization protein HflD [Gammaproteobacteria bacterium]|nr:high frequency lysogenization protein HflD [Gammaproteobacteria bacterium]
MKYSREDQTLALAGIFQAARLVQQIARNGQAPGAAIEASLESLFKIDSSNVIDIFGSPAAMTQGLKSLKQQLSGDNSKQDIEITRYVIALLHLEKKLSKSSTMLDQISQGIEKTRSQMSYFDLTHENVLASLGGLYQDTISQLSPRILVQGEHNYLSQQSNANKIRALLLAGIRAAVLWRQCGGSRLRLLFSRKTYLESAENILKGI